MPDTFNPTTDEIVNEGTRYINGQLMTWQPDPKIQETMDYLGIDREAAARMNGYTGDMADIDKPGSGAGGWVPGTFKKEVSPWKIIGLMAAAGAGGSALAGALPALLGGGAAAGGAGAAGAGTAGAASAAAPTLAATTGLTAAQAAALPGAMISGGTAAGIGGGAAAAAPAFSGLGGAGIGGTTAAVPTLGATSAIPTAVTTAQGVGGGTMAGGGTLGVLKNIFGLGGGKGSTTSDAIRLGLDVAGGYGQGKAAERAQENANRAADDADALVRYQLAANQARANINAPVALAGQTMYGDILKNYQPIAFDANGKLTGGLSAALFGDATRQAGEALSKRALDRALSDNPSGLPAIPTKTARAQAGVTDKILGGLGVLGGGLEAYDARQDRKTQQSQLQAIIDAFGGKSPGATGTGTTGSGGTGRDIIDPADYSPTFASSGAAPSQADRGDSDPLDLVNMPNNFLSRSRRIQGGRD